MEEEIIEQLSSLNISVVTDGRDKYRLRREQCKQMYSWTFLQNLEHMVM
jgi:hypothetical protein